MRMLALLTLLFGLTLAPIDQTDARRMGGMSSFGKKQTTHQTQPSKQTNSATGAAAGAGRTGMMGGMLGGLLAGSLLGALFFGGAFDGLGLMDILIFAGIAFLIVRFLKSRAAAVQPMQRRAATAGGPDVDVPHLPQSSLAGGAAGSSTAGSGSDIPFNLPARFDTAEFLGTARRHFVELQDAWNAYDMDKVKEFCSPALYAQLARQRAENAGAEHTVVHDLEAQIVRADSSAELAEISVLYTGLSRDTAENSEDPINEVWHLERDLRQGDSNWMIVGIQQRDE